MAIPAVLQSLGADPAEVLSEAGLDSHLFDDPDNLMSLAARGRLFAHCVARTGCRHFGLLVGQGADLHSLGLVGLLAKFSPDVATALRSLTRHFHLHMQGAATTLEVQGASALLCYEISHPRVDAIDQQTDGAVAVMLNIMRGLCGAQWKPAEVWFQHRRPADVRPFSRFFGVMPRFDAERNGLVFSAIWLSRRLADTDPEWRALLQKQIDALEIRHGADFPAQVRSVLRSALVTGNGTADQVASLFSMHRRTLLRRLNAFGTNFQELVDQVRFDAARQMLEESAMNVGQVAVLLEFADGRAFARAFRRWSGSSPTDWRSKRILSRND